MTSNQTKVKVLLASPLDSSQVARILQDNCQTCHRPGEVGPFKLMSYRDARAWAQAIRFWVMFCAQTLTKLLIAFLSSLARS